VLDYGCGPGGYVSAVSTAVGPKGEVYALDAMPIAVKMVKKLADEKKLTNVETVLSECSTGLPDEQIDVVLLYDVFHDLENQNAVLSELYRVLKPEGTLSFSDHHLKDSEIEGKVTGSGLFKLLKKNPLTYSFVKVSTAHK
jgi:ubiquinone/menaquinone biosynthesis C-methylase UbiE